MRRAGGVRQRVRRIDQGDMGKSLREIAELPFADRIAEATLAVAIDVGAELKLEKA